MRRKKLYIKQELDKSSLKAFITDYFKKNCPATYTLGGTYQCRQGAGRTLIDMMSICRAYFNKPTKKEVATVLYDLGYNKEIGVIQCCDARGLTFNMKDRYTGVFLQRRNIELHGKGIDRGDMDRKTLNYLEHEDNLSSPRDLCRLTNKKPRYYND